MPTTPEFEAQIEPIARTMSLSFGENPDEMRPATGCAGAPMVPKWRMHAEWARRHLAAHSMLGGVGVVAEPGRRDKAIAAAHGASEAIAELLRFGREGNSFEQHPFGGETVEQLLNAAKLAIEIEGIHTDERAQVYGAVCKFLEGWA